MKIDHFLPAVGVGAAIGRAEADPECRSIKVGFDFQIGLSARQEAKRPV